MSGPLTVSPADAGLLLKFVCSCRPSLLLCCCVWAGAMVELRALCLPGLDQHDSTETVRCVLPQGKKLVFVTNNATKSRQGYTKKFSSLGLSVSKVCTCTETVQVPVHVGVYVGMSPLTQWVGTVL